MSNKQEQSLWNFDNVKNINTLNEPKVQKKKKINPFDVEEHKKVLSPGLLHENNKIEPAKKSIQKNTVIQKNASSVVQHKKSETDTDKMEISKFLKQQQSPISPVNESPVSTSKPTSTVKSTIDKKVTEKLNKTAAEFKASEDVKSALTNIRENNQRQKKPVFDVVAYNEANSLNTRSLVRKQMGQFSLVAQNTVPEILKGKSWDNATVEQKGLAKKILLSICLLVVIGVGTVSLKAISENESVNIKPMDKKEKIVSNISKNEDQNVIESGKGIKESSTPVKK